MADETHSGELVTALEAALGADALVRDAADLARYESDWHHDYHGVARAVVRPRDAAGVAAAVRICAAAGVPFVPFGGNTGLVGATVPQGQGREVLIDMARLSRVRHVDPVGFTMEVEAGCVLEAAKAAAEAADCFFPLSLGAQGSCQIGGNIATNAGGVNVLRWGMMRDLVLGLEVVLPDGRLWRDLKRLRKDNTGYDLKQLFIGAEGTLGIVTAAVVKLFPRPEQVETALLAVASPADAMALYGLARRQCSDLLSAFELMTRVCIDLAREASPALGEPLDSPASHYVLLELSASGGVDLAALMETFLAVAMERGLVSDGVIAQSRQQAATLWAYREQLVEGQARRGHHMRSDISVPLTDLARIFDEGQRAIAALSPHLEPVAYGHVGDGNIHLNVLARAGTPAADRDRLLAAAETVLFDLVDAADGSISAEHGIGLSKRAAFAQRLPPLDAELMRGLKALLDPAGLLGQGRILP